ncbi:class I SAM-dependent methyltransferase [Flectobacillus longus]|uniref:class I SAM-dependent methyltransferase n=1 Tax=Flectobacillus longus TaxID=2984207 RepID=UPI0024B6BACA|nr:class I SAM-dependent methyltransferase [Flectobacillus longus]MDI9882150.1 class I SAM-dependent methyltransferase [Flectobacillus longus]
MLNSSHEEYKIMFEVEEKLWWYQILHQRVLEEIVENFGQNKEIQILDVGAGTGGLLTFLQKQGYSNIQGIDYSDSSLSFCQQRGLSVQKINAAALGDFFPSESFDVIICNDVVYCLESESIKTTLAGISKLLGPKGIFLTNNNAFNMFFGTHDIAVGGKHRFTKSTYAQYLPETLTIKKHTYWPFFLSPLILAVRQLQQLQLKLHLIDKTQVVSDVSLPSAGINRFFYQCSSIERKLFDSTPFGSSVFLTIKK